MESTESMKQETVDEWAVPNSEARGKVDDDSMAADFSHIKGWAVDADPGNDPTYPMKRWNGDDHKRLNYPRAVQQPITVEKLHSVERPSVSVVFGTSSPPSGLSGMLRRFAFRYSEERWIHWLTLLFADRVNAVEGVVDDLSKGHVPNVFVERGWKAEWKYNRNGMIKNIAIGAAFTAGAIIALSSRKKKRLV